MDRISRQSCFSGPAIELLESRRLLSGGVTVYVSDGSGNLFELNERSGVAKRIGNMGTVMDDIAVNRAGQMYGVSRAGADDSRLWRVNPKNGKTALIGNTGVFLSSLTFAPDDPLTLEPNDETLYGGAQGIYRLNLNVIPGSVATFSVGGFFGLSSGDLLPKPGFGGLNGKIFFSTGDNLNQWSVIDLSNAKEVNTIGPISFGDVTALAAGRGGVIYGISRRSNQLFSIDPITGEGELVANIKKARDIRGATSFVKGRGSASSSSVTLTFTAQNAAPKKVAQKSNTDWLGLL